MADYTVHFYEEAPGGAQQKYAVIIAKYRGRPLWCRHQERDTWEVPGGHIEPGETALEAAARELREETGALSFSLWPVCWYRLHFHNGRVGSFGLLCAAEVYTLGELHSEITEASTFDDVPVALTYPEIQPRLLAEVLHRKMA